MKKQINGMLVLALMMTAGCSSKSAVKSSESSEGKTVTSSPEPEASKALSSKDLSPKGYGFDKWQTGPLGDVFFEFDSSALSDDAQGQLKQNAAWLGANSLKKALIEGHCDSRGTSEYNLALG